MRRRKAHCLRGHERTEDNITPNGSCKQCRCERARDFQRAHPDKMSEYRKRWMDKNPGINIARHRRYRKEQPERVLNTRLQCRYGISLDDFHAMLDRQDNVCAICRDQFSEDNKPHVDHNHTTNAVRGLLCHKCNSGIGYLKEDIGTLTNAILYLEATTA